MSATLTGMRWWHLPQVQAIEADLFPADPWSPEQFWQELAQPTRTYLVALEAEEVVGYAGTFVMPPDADIQTVAVRPDQQGRGVARLLLTALIDDAEGRGTTHTLLEVRADNARALGLYESLGFVPISRRRRYYPDGGDAIILRRAAREQEGGPA
jgi:[ribosomal protein S18]-alanine N-acetyltransferase